MRGAKRERARNREREGNQDISHTLIKIHSMHGRAKPFFNMYIMCSKLVEPHPRQKHYKRDNYTQSCQIPFTYLATQGLKVDLQDSPTPVFKQRFKFNSTLLQKQGQGTGKFILHQTLRARLFFFLQQ